MVPFFMVIIIWMYLHAHTKNDRRDFVGTPRPGFPHCFLTVDEYLHCAICRCPHSDNCLLHLPKLHDYVLWKSVNVIFTNYIVKPSFPKKIIYNKENTRSCKTEWEDKEGKKYEMVCLPISCLPTSYNSLFRSWKQHFSSWIIINKCSWPTKVSYYKGLHHIHTRSH